MKFERLGSDWGGWIIAPELVRPYSAVISAGMGDDISFDMALLERFPLLTVIGIDPTPPALAEYQQNSSLPIMDRFVHVNKALWWNDEKVRLGGHATSVLSPDGPEYETITLKDLLFTEMNVSLIKLDIEGSEYPIIEHLESLKVDQLCIEWHHWLGKAGDECRSDMIHQYTIQDTLKAIRKIQDLGYNVVNQGTKHAARIIQETLFVRKDL